MAKSSQDATKSSTADGYRPIADYGVIGNCHTTALISSVGSIDWLCLPRFDSPSLFAGVLDSTKGGGWTIRPTGSFESHNQYLPDTNVLETVFRCSDGSARLLDFMPVGEASAGGTTHEMPAVIRIVEGLSGSVTMESVCAPRPNYARDAVTFDHDGSRLTFDRFALTGPAAWQIDDERCTARSELVVHAGERASFALFMPENDRTHPSGDPEAALDRTVSFWRTWARQCAYTGPYRDAVMRSVLALKLLTHTPTGAIVAAATASLPEEVGGERNWDYRFTWIRDASFTLYALLLAGFDDEDDAFFDWIVRTVQLGGTGINILYPISPAGDVEEQILEHLEGYRGSRPVRIGNAAVDQVQLDVYGEVLDALHFAWRVGSFDPRTVWQQFQPLVDWVAEHWREPESGIWEVRGGVRHFVFGKVMCWVALDRAIDLAETLGLPGDLNRWRHERDLIREDVFTRGWSERLQAFKQSYEDDRLDASNLLLSIVGFIEGDDPRMVSTIDATIERLVARDLFCYRYLDAPEGVSGSEATFVLCTFWLIDALILAGRLDEAQQRFEEMLEKASPLGLFAEEIDPETHEHLGNYPQAFSHIGVVNAAISLAHVRQVGEVEPSPEAAASMSMSGVGGARRTRSAERTAKPPRHVREDRSDAS